MFGAQELALAYGDYLQTMLDIEWLNKIKHQKQIITEDTTKIFHVLAQTNALCNI